MRLLSRHPGRVALAVLMSLVICSVGHASEPDGSSLSLAVWVSGTTAHFRVENTGNREVMVHKALSTPYGWPESCWLQVRDRAGKIIVTRETDENGYWSPLFYAASANVLPVELQVLPPGDSWEAESDLKACIESFASWPLIKTNRSMSESKALLKQVAAVKLTFQVKLDPMLSSKKSVETDWIPFSVWSDECCSARAWRIFCRPKAGGSAARDPVCSWTQPPPWL